jgi:hypothetical protein
MYMLLIYSKNLAKFCIWLLINNVGLIHWNIGSMWFDLMKQTASVAKNYLETAWIKWTIKLLGPYFITHHVHKLFYNMSTNTQTCKPWYTGPLTCIAGAKLVQIILLLICRIVYFAIHLLYFYFAAMTLDVLPTMGRPLRTRATWNELPTPTILCRRRLIGHSARAADSESVRPLLTSLTPSVWRGG